MHVYRREDIQQIDQLATEQGYSLFALMENAGKSLYEAIKPLLSREDKILILAGYGNNGGDGIVLARYLKLNEYNVSLTFPLGYPKSETARQHLHYYEQQGLAIDSLKKEGKYDVIIDSLLGVGTKLPLSEQLLTIIRWCNAQKGCLKIAIDMPTGVQANDGKTEEAFYADFTYCIHGFKPSKFLLPASEYYGETKVVGIGLYHRSAIQLITKEKVTKTFAKRTEFSHKGTFGTSLLIAGSDEMPGSALLSAIGAVRSGTGKLAIATSKMAAQIIATRVPEATFILDGLERINQHFNLEQFSAVGIGPGLTEEEKVIPLLQKLSTLSIPVVFDAGAIIPFSKWKKQSFQGPVIFTPHPGEFSRLIDQTIPDIQADRINLSQKFAKENGVTVVLKGKYTVLAFPDGEIFINPTGNHALAKGGSGDVLTGMLISMLSTHVHWKDAVKNAVYLHGLCAEAYVKQSSPTSMAARDFDHLLPIVFKEVENATEN